MAFFQPPASMLQSSPRASLTESSWESIASPPIIAEAMAHAAAAVILIWHEPRIDPEKPTTAVFSSTSTGGASVDAVGAAGRISMPNITLNISVTVESARERLSDAWTFQGCRVARQDSCIDILIGRGAVA